MRRIKTRALRGSFGTYAPDSGEIEISVKLTPRSIPSRPFVIKHELFHEYLHKNKISLNPLEEEQLADLWSLLSCKNKEISYLEVLLKRIIMDRFGKNKSKRNLIKNKNKYLKFLKAI